jgi:hypothetical protein
MSEGNRNRGACVYCGREATRGGMARHLRACEKRDQAIGSADEKQGDVTAMIHLQVQSARGDDHWLHLEMNGSANLNQLDSYLRAIWLECCGHHSRFSLGGWRGDEIGMTKNAEKVFEQGVELTHIYDFGTETVTLIKAVDSRRGKPLTRYPIALMARNEAPSYSCQECQQPATHLCVECIYEDEQPGTLCQEHAGEHPHDDYGEPMPLVNSPRIGMCGYEGPAEPPY